MRLQPPAVLRACLPTPVILAEWTTLRAAGSTLDPLPIDDSLGAGSNANQPPLRLLLLTNSTLTLVAQRSIVGPFSGNHRNAKHCH